MLEWLAIVRYSGRSSPSNAEASFSDVAMASFGIEMRKALIWGSYINERETERKTEKMRGKWGSIILEIDKVKKGI